MTLTIPLAHSINPERSYIIVCISTFLTGLIFVGFITIMFGYIPAGFGLSVYIILPLAFIAMYIGIQVFGKSVEIEYIQGDEVLDI